MTDYPSQRIRAESMMTRRIELLDSEGKQCMVASGFVVCWNGRQYLVSNRHVFTGRTGDNRLVTEGARIPFRARVSFPSSEGHEAVVLTFPLFDEEKQSTWVQHPTGRHEVDVAAMPLDARLAGVETVTVATDGMVSFEDVRLPPKLSVGQEVFVLGFPFGANGGTDLLSIWVGATIATEPSFDLQGRPRLMIDGATREGLSGAPVWAYWPAGKLISFERNADGIAAGELSEGSSACIGIYSGRLHDDAQLGYVWKLTVVLDVVANGAFVDNVVEDALR